MKGFRHAALVVTAAYAITYGVLVFIESRWIEAYQLAGDRAKFPPQAAWIFAALHATMIFGAIAVSVFFSQCCGSSANVFVLDDAEFHRSLLRHPVTRLTNRWSQPWPLCVK